jgi:hypothetical protein
MTRVAVSALAAQFRGALAIACAMAFLVIAGCTPESRNHLPDKDRIAPDERLIGHWHGNVEGADYVAEVTRSDPLTLHLALTETLPIGKQPVTKTGYLINVYVVGSRTVLAIRDIEPTPGNWRFAVVVFGGDDRVTLMFMDGKFVRNEVFRSALGGIIQTDDPTFPDVLLTANPDDLSTFIHNTDEARLFDVPFGVFERQP